SSTTGEPRPGPLPKSRSPRPTPTTWWAGSSAPRAPPGSSWRTWRPRTSSSPLPSRRESCPDAMVVIQDAYVATDLPQGGVAAIGNFDAIHLGHRAILDRVTAKAAELGAPTVLITFDPHPAAVLRPEMPTPVRLTTPEQ